MADEELFSFAKPDWKEKLDQEKLEQICYLIQQYEACTSRIRACRAPIQTRKRQNGIDRILFARGQENEIDPERKQLLRETDPPIFQKMMRAYQNKADFQSYEEPAAEVFRAEIKTIMPLREAVKYVVALGNRKLLWELLPNEIEKNVLRRKNDGQ